MFKINNALTRIIGICLFTLIVCLFLFINISRVNKAKPIEVLVASQDIPSGIYLKPEMVVKIKLPARLANSNEIKDLEEVAGLTTITAIPKGAPIVYNQFSPTEKAQAPIQSHNPTNYILIVDENTRVGKIFKPKTNYSYFLNFKWSEFDVPLAVFPKVKFIYTDSQPVKPFGYAQNTTRQFTLTPIQTEKLKELSGQSIQLILKGVNGDEVTKISSLKE
jgi:hypothetical protein